MSEDEDLDEIDEFPDCNKNIYSFKKSLINPHGLHSEDILFYWICYGIRYNKSKKTDQRSDINLIKDIGELYDELNENK